MHCDKKNPNPRHMRPADRKRRRGERERERATGRWMGREIRRGNIKKKGKNAGNERKKK
jgi:hypothetical protein